MAARESASGSGALRDGRPRRRAEPLEHPSGAPRAALDECVLKLQTSGLWRLRHSRGPEGTRTATARAPRAWGRRGLGRVPHTHAPRPVAAHLGRAGPTFTPPGAELLRFEG